MVTAPAKKRSAKHRASWKGHLAFGLVSFPVQAFNALNREGSDIHFHQLHSVCHRRIHYQKVCPVHGEVPNDEIISGYEYRKGKYVEVDTDELDALRTRKERALTIDAFVEPQAVDPLYFDGRMYYLSPDGGAAEEPYRVLVEAMEREERYGLGQVVFSGKEQIALVRPLHRVLHMAMLNYAAEIREPEKVVHVTAHHAGLQRKVQLAQTLIRSWFSKDIDFEEDYEDRYRKKVRARIRAKVEGHEMVEPQEEDEDTEVINLMDALQKSLQKAGRRGAEKPRHRQHRRPA